jgi:2-keto-4-pentenoate hydratase/2-oxohepta-3-ene-1,7-dioic acid hydratase in catechol pathway
MKIIRVEDKTKNIVQLAWCEQKTEYYEFNLTEDGKLSLGQKIEIPPVQKYFAPCLPKKMVAIAINFKEVIGFSEDMEEPMIFVMPSTSLADPMDTILNPFPTKPWWGESELAAVISKPAKNIKEEDVDDYILGFTIANDVTVENVEKRDHHLARSKCCDGFCPVGPWIDTEFNANDCVIEAIQNGEIIRRGRSSEQFWQYKKIISELSKWTSLEPWDVILTGNPPDTVGMRYLEDGDTYVAKVHGLGELENRFELLRS